MELSLAKFHKEVAKALQKENAAFNRLSKAAKRVALAKDVLEQIKAKRYSPTSGVYVEVNATEAAEEFGLSNLDDLEANKALLTGMASCTVCAKGALFMSHVMKTNDCTIDQANNSDDSDSIGDRLDDIFDRDQLDLIESAFERDSNHCSGTDNSDDLVDKAVDFGYKYSNSDKRLIGIMNNIIKNKGIFKP